jgi:hypothetical protein
MIFRENIGMPVLHRKIYRDNNISVFLEKKIRISRYIFLKYEIYK